MIHENIDGNITPNFSPVLVVEWKKAWERIFPFLDNILLHQTEGLKTTDVWEALSDGSHALLLSDAGFVIYRVFRYDRTDDVVFFIWLCGSFDHSETHFMLKSEEGLKAFAQSCGCASIEMCATRKGYEKALPNWAMKHTRYRLEI